MTKRAQLMAMDSQHYQMVADSIRKSLNDIIAGGDHQFYARHYAYDLAHRLADQFEAELDNPAFDREEFINLCGFTYK